MKVINWIRNLKILLQILKYWKVEYRFYSPRKRIKEARLALGYDDIGEWF